jgi:hypothetical protein
VAFEIIGTLLDLILKALAAGVLWVLMRGVNAGRIDTAAPAALPAVPDSEPAEPVEEAPTVWQRSEAAGAVWRTADEAATGARGATRLPPAELPASAIFRDEGKSPTPAETPS